MPPKAIELSQIQRERGSCGIPFSTYPLKLHDIWPINAGTQVMTGND